MEQDQWATDFIKFKRVIMLENFTVYLYHIGSNNVNVKLYIMNYNRTTYTHSYYVLVVKSNKQLVNKVILVF